MTLFKAIAAGTTLGMAVLAGPASATTVFSETFSSGFGVFTNAAGNNIVVTAANPGYIACCGVNGSTAALNNPFVAFGGGNDLATGAITTAFATQLGKAYTLTFDYGAFGGGTTTLSYALDGLTTTLTPTANNNIDSVFTTQTVSFVGTGSNVSLSFFSSDAGFNVDPILDNVTVTALPEPATWAMMLAGFGMVGFGMRRRAVKTTVTYA